jgi:hypothetical protein
MSDQHTESLFLSFLKSFLISFADKPAVWYSLKPISNDIPSLPSLLSLSYEQMLHVFDVCGLWDVSGNYFKAKKLAFFIDSNSLKQVVEHTRVGIRNSSGGSIVHHHALCIGNRSSGILNKPCYALEVAMRPSRKLASIQNEFKEKITTACRQWLVDGVASLGTSKDMTNKTHTAIGKFIDSLGAGWKQEVEGRINTTKDQNDVGDSCCSLLLEEPPSSVDGDDENLLHFRIRTRLLPLLLVDNYKSNCKELENVLFDIVAELQKEREERISNILGSSQISVSPNSKESPTMYPVMKQYHIPLHEARVHEALLKELYQLNKKYFNSRSMFVDLGDNKKSTFVLVPHSQGYNRLRRNELQHQWFHTLMTALGGPGNEAASARDLFVHVSRLEQFQDEMVEAVKQSGLRTFPSFDPVATFAMQSAANLNEAQLVILRRCCKAECGDYLFSSPFKMHRVFDLEHVQPTTGTYQYGSEKIPWMYKSVIEVIRLYLKTLLCESKGKSIARQVDVSICVDHGKGHSRASMLVVARFGTEGQDDKSEWSTRQQHFSVGSARCRKDSAEIVACTFGDKLNDDLKHLKTVGVVEFFQKGGGGNLFEDGFVMLGHGNVAADDAVLIGEAEIELFMSGDLLWFHTALGKEGYQSWWCPYCLAFKNDWQEKTHEIAPAWTLESLKEQARKIAAGEVRKKVAREVLGVKTAPVIDAVEVGHYVIPVLHLTIGLVNDVLDHLVGECQAAAEEFTQRYYELEIELGQVDREVSLASETLATFLAGHKEIIKDGRRRLLRHKNTMTEEEAANLETNLGQLEAERTALQKNLDTLKNTKHNVEAAFRVEVDKPENSRNFGQPLRAFIDDVLRKYSIDRAVQHGGKLEGNQCRKLLSKSGEILLEIKQYICSRPPEFRIVGTDDEIEQVFHWHEVLLVALDGLFSGLRTTRYKVNNEIIDRTIQFRDRVMSISRYIGEFLVASCRRCCFVCYLLVSPLLYFLFHQQG